MSKNVSFAQAIDQTLPTGWAWSTLEEVADVLAGNPAPQGEELFINGKHPFVRVQDMGRLADVATLNVTNDSLNDKGMKGLRLFPKGSVLFTKSGASTLLNQRAILGRDMYVVSHIAVAIPRDRILSKWLYHWLRTVDFIHLAHATTLPSLPLSKARSIPVPVAPLDEQELIVLEIEKQFSRLDKAIVNLRRIKANIKRYKAAVLNAGVEGRLVETEESIALREGRNYETGAQLLQRMLECRRSQWKGKGKYKEPIALDAADLPEIPRGWTWGSLEQVGQQDRPIIYGIIKPGPHDPNGVPYVRVTEMKDGVIDLQKLRKAAPARASKFTRATLASGDILISKDGTIGRVAVVPPQLAGGNITQHVMRAPVHEAMCRDYVVWAIRSGVCQRWLTGETRGVALRGVNVRDFRRLPIPVPPSLEQERIHSEVDRRFSLVREVELEVEKNLRRASALRKSILSKAFFGQLISVHMQLELPPELSVTATGEELS